MKPHSHQQMSSCPFNKAHTFSRQKFLFHIQRCKDKQKVIHLFQKCQFNPFHFVPKEEIEMHECCCPSRQENVAMTKRLEANFRRSLRESRQRSRERNRSRERQNGTQEKENKFEESSIMVVKSNCSQMEDTLEDCEECQRVLKTYKDKIMKSNNEKLKKFIIKYYDLENQDYHQR